MLNHSVAAARLFAVLTSAIMVYAFVSGNYLTLPQKLNIPLTAQTREINPMDDVAYRVIDPKQYKCLQENIFFEARNQPIVGQVMVGLTVIARARSEQFPSTYCGVVFEKYQYSWTNKKKKPNLKNVIEKDAWDTAGKVAKLLMTHNIDTGTINVTHYHTTAVKPYWSKDKSFVASVTFGDHIFYKQKDG